MYKVYKKQPYRLPKLICRRYYWDKDPRELHRWVENLNIHYLSHEQYYVVERPDPEPLELSDAQSML